MGGVSQHFLRAWGSGVDLILMNILKFSRVTTRGAQQAPTSIEKNSRDRFFASEKGGSEKRARDGEEKFGGYRERQTETETEREIYINIYIYILFLGGKNEGPWERGLGERGWKEGIVKSVMGGFRKRRERGERERAPGVHPKLLRARKNQKN